MIHSLKALWAGSRLTRLALGFAALCLLLLPELAFAQTDALGVNNAFNQVSSGLIKPVVLGVRGLMMLAAIVYGLFSLFKAVKEASGKEALIGIGLFFFALVMYNPLIITDTLLGMGLEGSVSKYGIQEGFGA